MSKKNLPPIHRKSSVSFDIDNSDGLIVDPLPPIIDKLDKYKEREFVVHVGVQTDIQWLEGLKKDLLSSLKAELNSQEKISSNLKSKPSTVRSKRSKISSGQSKVKTESLIREDTELGSEMSEESGISIPPYPEMKVDDEFGISLFGSSDDDDDNFDPERISQVVKNPTKSETVLESKDKEHKNTASIIPDAGLPTILKVSKELGSSDLSPPLSADTFLINALTPKEGEICEFCKRPLVPMPSLEDQVSNSVNQSELFCCQQYRDLVDFALAQNGDLLGSGGKKKSGTELIDISPHKSTKSSDEIAESKAKSERKIRERLLARQQAALIAAEASKIRTQSTVEFETDVGLNDQQITTRQMKMINYQLSSYKFIEDGWTVSPLVLSDFEMTAHKEMTGDVIEMDFTKSIYDLFGQANLSAECSASGVVRQHYPDGKLFLVLFQDGKGSIYYPSGNLAISMVRPSLDSSVICIIKEDTPSIDSRAKVLALVNTNGFGSFSFTNEYPRIVFNTLFGVELNRDGTKKRQWFWSGEPHVHAPPFQPVCFSINKYIGVRISSQSSIFINFIGYTKQIHINVGCKVEIPMKIRNKMHNMVKLENDALQGPLTDLKIKVRSFIEKCNEALDHPFLVAKNNWPIRPYIQSKNASENRNSLSLSWCAAKI